MDKSSLRAATVSTWKHEKTNWHFEGWLHCENMQYIQYQIEFEHIDSSNQVVFVAPIDFICNNDIKGSNYDCNR